MSDNYQAVFDAVRSQLCNCDVGQAVENALRQASIDFYFQQASNRIQEAASNYDLPSVIYRPQLTQDGNQWCALYGINLHDGVCGFGDTPDLAMQAFNKAWYEKIAPTPSPGREKCENRCCTDGKVWYNSRGGSEQEDCPFCKGTGLKPEKEL